MDELKKLARAWKLNERRNFWKTHTTQDQLVEALKKHLNDSILASTAKNPDLPPPPAKEIRKKDKEIRDICTFHPTFKTRSGVVRTYCGHKIQTVIRHTDDILTRSRYFAFPGDDNTLDRMISGWRVEGMRGMPPPDDQDQGRVSENRPEEDPTCPSTSSLEESTGSIYPKAFGTHTGSSQQRVLKQRALSIHLLAYSCHGEAEGYEWSRKAVETFLDVGESSDSDTISNAAMAISNIAAIRKARTQLVELNAIHRYSSFLPYLTTPNAASGCARFFYYMSCELELEDRICSAGFKAFQKNSVSDDFQLRIVTLQCLSNLMPCSERVRISELVVTTLHHMYRDFLEQTWTRDVFQVLSNVTSFPNVLRVMVDADVMDVISVAAAEVRDDITSGRLLAQTLSHFLYQIDLAEELVHADYARIFIDLLAMEDMAITEMCMRAFAVMSSHDGYVTSLCDSDIVHIVCSFVGSSESIDKSILVDIGTYLCNISQPQVKGLEQRVADGAADALLHISHLGRGDSHLQYLSVLGIRDLLSSKKNCVDLFDRIVPYMLNILKTSRGSLDVNVVQCVNNISCASECYDKLVQYEMDLEILTVLKLVYTRESVAVVGAFLTVIILLSKMEVVVKRILDNNIIPFLLQLVQFTSSKGAPTNAKECWSDISRLLLAIIYQQPELTPQQLDEVVQILSLVGRKGSSEEIVTDCAVVLAFLSYSMSDFAAVDSMVRSILDISESDTVMDAASTVLYNVSCSEEHSQILLSDGTLHINIMIRMMRNGSSRVQQNVAEAMRLLCIQERCNELLLQKDLLSDFIVIALLRTNSGDVKKVCSEAFYNMLCHDITRTRLLKGDLWWAMMRLAKTDIESIRLVCAHAVYNLASDSNNIRALRTNYILAFVKEIAFDGSSKYLDIFLHVINNVMLHSESEGEDSLQHSELSAIIHTLIDALHKLGDNVSSTRWVGYLLSKATSLALGGSCVNEFIHMDITSSLYNNVEAWTNDVECRQHFSAVLCKLVTQQQFTNSTPVTEMLPLVHMLIKHEHTVSRNGDVEYQPLPLDMIVCENVCSILLSYASRGQVEPEQILCVPFFTAVMKLSLTGESPFTAYSRGLQQRGHHKSSSNQIDLDIPVNHLSAIFLKLLVFVLDMICSPSDLLNEYKRRKPGLLDSIVQVVGAVPVKGLMNSQLFLDTRTRDNVIHAIHALCGVESIATDFVHEGIFAFLAGMFESSSLVASIEFVEFCAVLCRNLTSYPLLIPLIVAAPSIDSLLYSLVMPRADTTTTSTKKQKRMEQLHINRLSDVAAVLLRVSGFRLMPDNAISPSSALALVSTIANSAKEEDTLGHVTKLIIGNVLDKTEEGQGFDPSFVRAILSEINDEEGFDDSKIQAFVESKQLQFVKINLEPLIPPYVVTKEKEPLTPEKINALWKPFVSKERKKMNVAEVNPSFAPPPSSISQFNASSGVTYEPVAPLPLHAYEKIITTYPYLCEPTLVNAKKEREEALLSSKRDVNSPILEEEDEAGRDGLEDFSMVSRQPSIGDSSTGSVPHPPDGSRSSNSTPRSRIVTKGKSITPKQTGGRKRIGSR